MAYGKINKSFFFGLPGNPVSAVVTFQLFVLAAIEKYVGIKGRKWAVLAYFGPKTVFLSKKNWILGFLTHA